MVLVSHLAEHLLQLGPQANAQRLTFYNYLKNTCDLSEELTEDTFDQFYRKALCYPHWQSQKDELGRTVLNDFKSFAAKTPLKFQWDSIRHAHWLQVVDVANGNDLSHIIVDEINRSSDDGEKVRVLQVSDNRSMALRLSQSNELTVEVYPRLALIDGSRLVPMAPLTQLRYNQFLDLCPQVTQTLEVSLMLTAKFQTTETQKAHGLLIKGYSFQKHESFQGPVSQVPELFYALKSLERHYINPHSDPFYQELTSLLERAGEILRSGRPEGEKLGLDAVKKGRMALKKVFPNDKLILLLVTNLEYMLNRRSQTIENSSSSVPTEEKCHRISPIRS